MIEAVLTAFHRVIERQKSEFSRTETPACPCPLASIYQPASLKPLVLRAHTRAFLAKSIILGGMHGRFPRCQRAGPGEGSVAAMSTARSISSTVMSGVMLTRTTPVELPTSDMAVADAASG